MKKLSEAQDRAMAFLMDQGVVCFTKIYGQGSWYSKDPFQRRTMQALIVKGLVTLEVSTYRNTYFEHYKPTCVYGAVKTIHISGRRWFDTGAGNTYFSAQGYVNGVLVSSIDFEYGYGNHYHDQMIKQLEKENHIPPRNGDATWQYSERLGIKLTEDVVDVKRRKDL